MVRTLKFELDRCGMSVEITDQPFERVVELVRSLLLSEGDILKTLEKTPSLDKIENSRKILITIEQ